ncbi:MAG TPA: glycosyltransferase family 2 protein [Bordetella sp.]
MEFSILMPCLNEAETLAACIEKAQDWLQRTGALGEIIIADNGSHDGSQEIARKHGARVVDVALRGYGEALYQGAMAARGEYIIMGDSDGSYDFGALDGFTEKLVQGYDLVVGNRFLGGISHGAMPWKNRYIGNPLLTRIGRLLFNCPVKDMHCGLRGFSKQAFLRMDLRTTGMEFASEMIIKASLLDMRIAEVPTRLSKDGRTRAPHLRPWRDGWRHFRFMLLFSPRWLFLIPGLITMFVSIFFYLAIFAGQLKIGGVVFDINTLFYAQTGITVGLIAIMLGLAVRMFGMYEGLLKKNRMFETLRAKPILEIGGILGIALAIFGGYLGVRLLKNWSSAGFGVLQQGIFLKTVSLSTLSMTLGGIIFLMSLIMGFLALPIRRDVEKNHEGP